MRLFILIGLLVAAPLTWADTITELLSIIPQVLQQEAQVLGQGQDDLGTGVLAPNQTITSDAVVSAPIQNGGVAVVPPPVAISAPANSAVVMVASPAMSDVAVAGSNQTAASAGVPVQFQGSNSAKLSGQMSGQVIRVPKQLGDSFRKGDVLVAFACEKEKAALASAVATEAQARKVVDAKQQLVSMQAAPPLALDSAKADLVQASAKRAVAQAAVDDCVVTAPFNGRVGRVYVNNWETVQQGAPLLEVVNDADIKVSALLPSSWLVWLRVGQVFHIHVNELDRTVDAKVSALGAAIDPVSHTVPMEAHIINVPADLLPGMSGTASFPEAGGE